MSFVLIIFFRSFFSDSKKNKEKRREQSANGKDSYFCQKGVFPLIQFFSFPVNFFSPPLFSLSYQSTSGILSLSEVRLSYPPKTIERLLMIRQLVFMPLSECQTAV